MPQDVLSPTKSLNKNFTYIDLKNFTVDVQIENNGNIFATWNHSLYCVSQYKIVLSEGNKNQSTLITDVPDKLQSRLELNLSKIFNFIKNRTYTLKIYLESTNDYNIGIASIEKRFTFDMPYATPTLTPSTTPSTTLSTTPTPTTTTSPTTTTTPCSDAPSKKLNFQAKTIFFCFLLCLTFNIF